MQPPQIITLTPKKLIGKSLPMSVSKDLTFQLWQSFMQNRKSITNAIGTDLYCLQVYSNLFDFKAFNPDAQFEKWAAIEVADFNSIPEGFSSIELETGLYAVFNYKGLPSAFGAMLNYIYSVWFPSSDYELDARPHFQVMGAKYSNTSPESEEEIWVPIKHKLRV